MRGLYAAGKHPKKYVDCGIGSPGQRDIEQEVYPAVLDRESGSGTELQIGCDQKALTSTEKMSHHKPASLFSES